MGRKILDKLSQAHADKPAGPPRRLAGAVSVGGLREGLERLNTNSVRDLDPAVIEQDGLRDRLPFDEADIASLADSIQTHGQQVPILVRPSDRPGHFRVIYGRRRLAAIRRIGGTVKAIVRPLDDRASVIAQGQENNLRLDPSFIEKALFIGAMRDAGYDGAVIRDALGISKQSVSTYVVVLDAVPVEVIEAIGPAHDTGRRRWTELADLGRQAAVDLSALLPDLRDDLADLPTSTARFDRVLAAAQAAVDRPAPVHRGGPARELCLADGRRVATVKAGAGGLEMRLTHKDAPEFGKWLEANLDDLIRELHGRWQDESGGQA